jgi:hypothetical protein
MTSTQTSLGVRLPLDAVIPLERNPPVEAESAGLPILPERHSGNPPRGGGVWQER